jgi:hypothetical protein
VLLDALPHEPSSVITRHGSKRPPAITQLRDHVMDDMPVRTAYVAITIDDLAYNWVDVKILAGIIHW